MSASQFCFTWNSFKNNVSKGLSHLQQNAHFVDMTIATGGQFIKVHQNILSVASPYLKEILLSVPCPHPIVFLNNVSPDILGHLVEYIYTGEVNIPSQSVSLFVEACKTLGISGVKNFILPKKMPASLSEPVNDIVTMPTDNNYAAHITINTQDRDFNLEVLQVDNSYNKEYSDPVKLDDKISEIDLEQDIGTSHVPALKENTHEDTVSNNTSVDDVHSAIFRKHVIKTKKSAQPSGLSKTKQLKMDVKSTDGTALYTVSNRGSLQLLLNRHMYNFHHHSCGGRKRRWRCIDYRKIHCPAIIDTDGDEITNKVELHEHANHDTKIFKKMKKDTVFTSLSNAIQNSNEHGKEENTLDENQFDNCIDEMV